VPDPLACSAVELAVPAATGDNIERVAARRPSLFVACDCKHRRIDWPWSPALRFLGDWRRDRQRGHESAPVAYSALVQAGDRRRSYEATDILAIGADGAIFEACVGHVEVIGSEKAAEAARDWRNALAAQDLEAADEARLRLVKATRGGRIRRLCRRAFG
jgi:hypothetical protein